MKRTLDVPAEILENTADFKDDFFVRFPLRHADSPLQLNDKISKNYLFPTFYSDVTCAQAIFMCSYEKAARLLAEKLHPRIKPVRMTKGRAIAAFSCYEYKKVLGVRPYNEIAVAIPVMVNASFSPPVLPMVRNFEHFGYYIASMPVTSEENRIRGNKIWGLPKVTQDIDIRREGATSVTTAMEEDGKAYLTLRIPTTGPLTNFNASSFLYSKLDGKIIRSPTKFTGVFHVVKNMKLLFNKGVIPETPCIQLGDSKSAEMLRDLEIEQSAFQFRYIEGMRSCFDLPDKNMPDWAKLT